MSLTTEGMTPADIAAVTGNRGGNGGFGYGGDSTWFIIILFLFALMNGSWGNNGNNGGGSGSYGMYPWLNQSNQINDGFREQMVYGQINGIQNSITSGFGDVATALCGGFAGVNASITGAQNAITQQMYANQIADMQQNYAAQTATLQGFNNLTAQNADLKYNVATEACADRNAIAQGIRDVMENCNRNYQGIMDKLCQLELDGVKGQLAQAQRDNIGLQNQLNMANMQASQVAQTAQILQGQNAEVDALYNRLKNCPVPCQPVYGNQPVFTCNGNQGCACGAMA